MDSEELRSKLAALKKLQGLDLPTPEYSSAVSDRISKLTEIIPELSVPDFQMSDPEISRTISSEPSEEIEETPLTQIDDHEVRKQALERLKNRENQKLNFRGGFLEQNDVYDNN